MSQGTRTLKDQIDEKKKHQEGESQQEDNPAHHKAKDQRRQRFDDGSSWHEDLIAFLDVEAIRKPDDDPTLLQASLTAACQRVFSEYKASTDLDSAQIERDVEQHFGNWLLRYPNLAHKDAVLELIVINILINAEMEERNRSWNNQKAN